MHRKCMAGAATAGSSRRTRIETKRDDGKECYSINEVIAIN